MTQASSGSATTSHDSEETAQPPMRRRAAKAQSTPSALGAAPTVKAAPRTAFRPALWGLGVALIAICVLAGIFVYNNVSSSVAVVGTSRTIEAGTIISREDLVAVQAVPDPNLHTIPADQASDQVIGKRAVVDIPAGSYLPSTAVADYLVPTKGQSVIGLNVRYGGGPADTVKVGDKVRLIVLPAENADPNASQQETPDPAVAYVTTLRPADDGSGVLVDVTIDSAAAAPFQAAASQGLLTLVVDSQER